MGKNLRLMHNGAPVALPKFEALRLRPRLDEALDSDVRLEKVKGAEFGWSDSEHDYHFITILPRHREDAGVLHRRAWAYIEAWRQGGRDAMDSHYARESYESWLKEVNSGKGGES